MTNVQQEQIHIEILYGNPIDLTVGYIAAECESRDDKTKEKSKMCTKNQYLYEVRNEEKERQNKINEREKYPLNLEHEFI